MSDTPIFDQLAAEHGHTPQPDDDDGDDDTTAVYQWGNPEPIRTEKEPL